MASPSRKRSPGSLQKECKMKSRRVKRPEEEIEWGEYSTNFDTSGKGGGVEELHRFIQALDGRSAFPSTRLGNREYVMKQVRPLTKLDGQEKLQSILRQPFPQEDIILLEDSDSLRDALEGPFHVPLLHRTTVDSPSLLSGRSTILDLISRLSTRKECTVSVYDFSIEDPAKRTRQTTVAELSSRFQRKEERSHGQDENNLILNFLDIENNFQVQYCPPNLLYSDLRTKLRDSSLGDIGKTNSDWKPVYQKEFFILSTANAISTVHVDTGGTGTWAGILSGRKIWYFPRRVTTQTLRLLAELGSVSPEISDEWIKVELREGDFFVMPPSLPHAVFTPEDCLMVGGTFYTAGTLDQTLEGLEIQEKYPEISNEDLNDTVYNSLEQILIHCNFMDVQNKIRILGCRSLFTKCSKGKGTSKLTKKDIMGHLTSIGVKFNPGKRKHELLQLYRSATQGSTTQESATQESTAQTGTTLKASREEFVESLEKFCDKLKNEIMGET
ncbi:uncharacterized protein K452DRAFT_257227 [Aplosporella prunicola CBS 121167]|uniref:[histone H3]-dimethyl-L-lysine(36) demethylase n=1 Tax=Aplosporella prunicola CBS 121167 TaxID=1176127 RepID=A0A6A6B308_9PEZI|nr:uncharacterized protein K452DRAFT_257227 [Aplosporella prunicola CBS 121167]KAF2137763.1 hypothetical protein K452DRAFT_257227 [Aplosporella prunicola CBS 121167]